VLLGLCGGIFPGALAAYAYERGIRMGKFTSHSGLGFGSGSIIAGLIVLFWGQSGHALGREIYNPVFVGSALMFFVSFALIFRLPFPEAPKFKVPLFPKKIIRDNLAIYSSLLIRHTGACAVWAFFALFIYYLQPPDTPQQVRFFWVGMINGVNGVFQYIFMQFIDRFDHHKLIVTGFLTSALTFITFTAVNSIIELVLTQILLAFAWSCLYVGSICLIMDRNPEHATSAGLLGSTLNGAQVLGPLAGGAVASFFASMSLSVGSWHIGGPEIGGYRWIMLIAALLSLLALVVYSMELGREKRICSKHS
jgi:MFS family permease